MICCLPVLGSEEILFLLCCWKLKPQFDVFFLKTSGNTFFYEQHQTQPWDWLLLTSEKPTQTNVSESAARWPRPAPFSSRRWVNIIAVTGSVLCPPSLRVCFWVQGANVTKSGVKKLSFHWWSQIWQQHENLDSTVTADGGGLRAENVLLEHLGH